MAVYLFDERRWLSDDPDAYAEFLQGAVTDLIVLVYGYRHGGVIGWTSRFIGSAVGFNNRLMNVVAAMSKKSIRVHAAFQVCRFNRKAPFKPYNPKSKFVDVHNPMFQSYIINLMSECAELPIGGVCMDYIRTDDYSNVEKNDSSLGSIVKKTYEKIKQVNPDCVVSSTTSPYKDLTNKYLRRTGRKAINWANKGYQDVLFDMKYGGIKGETGDPPNMELVYKARKLTKKPIVVMVASYKIGNEGKPVPTDAAQFSKVLDSVFYENDLAIYTGWLFTEEQALLVRQAYG